MKHTVLIRTTYFLQVSTSGVQNFGILSPHILHFIYILVVGHSTGTKFRIPNSQVFEVAAVSGTAQQAKASGFAHQTDLGSDAERWALQK